MKYYFSLLAVFFLLYFVEFFFARISPVFSFSFILVFLLTFAFFVPSKTRYYYRSLIPISIICGLAADGMSALPTGVVFIVYLAISFLIMNIAKNLPQGEDLRALALIIFCSVFILRIILSLAFNYSDMSAVGGDIVPAFFSAVFSFVIGLSLAFLMETKKGTLVAKILFSED